MLFIITLSFKFSQGDQIHASVKSVFVKRHTNYLKEGNTVVISNLNVSNNGGSYRTTSHPYRVHFVHTTTVRLFKDDGQIDRNVFQLRSFTQILSPQFDNNYLIGNL